MDNFQYYMPTRIVFGPGKLDEIGNEARKIGTKAMLVTGKSSMKRFGILARLENNLKAAGVETVTYSQAEPNPRVETVDRGARIAGDERCDMVIGLGGGSAIDVAKGISIVATQGGSIWNYMGAGKKPEEVKPITRKTLPIIAIPSTSGTGTETTLYTVVTNSKLKLKDGAGSPYLFPRISIIDPEITALMTTEITAYTGMDAFGQALEGYTSKAANISTDTLAIEALRLISGNLGQSCRNGQDLESRANMAWGAALSGMVISQVDANLCHAMSHPVSAHYNIAHGLAVGLLTPATMAYNLDAVPEKYANLARIMGENIEGLSVEDAARIAIKTVMGLMNDIGFPQGLREIGITEEGVEKLAEDTLLMGALETNIKEAGLDDVVNIFKNAL